MHCIICKSANIEKQLDVGAHPVSTFFLPYAEVDEKAINLSLAQCQDCGTIQLVEPVPYQDLIPPEFVPAREPEEHLDEAVAKMCALPGLSTDSVIAAVSYKDDTTVDRFTAKGFGKTWRIDLAEDLGITDPNANIETLQARVSPETMAPIAERRGAADLLLVRHISEHAEDPATYMAGLAALVKPGGYIMIEIPDCTRNLELNDYCMIWEEHSLYLTPATLQGFASMGGFETVTLDVYPRSFENSIVYVGRKTADPRPPVVAPEAKAETGILAAYAAAYEPAKRELRARLQTIRDTQGPVALFGAGHLACAFVNYMDVADLVDFVADDTPVKQGKFLPGAKLPIVSSAALTERGAALCLLALTIENEDKVIAKNTAFTEAGGVFQSVFRASGRSVFQS